MFIGRLDVLSVKGVLVDGRLVGFVSVDVAATLGWSRQPLVLKIILNLPIHLSKLTKYFLSFVFKVLQIAVEIGRSASQFSQFLRRGVCKVLPAILGWAQLELVQNRR